jgi:mannosyltransferase
MTVFYDNLVYSLQHYGGISTYWYELTSRLLKESELELKFYETGREWRNICRKKLNIASTQVIQSNRAGILLERFLKLPPQTEPHLFHSSYFRIPVKTRQTSTVTTVHDFIHDLYFTGARAWLHNMMKRKAILQSDLIIAVSEHTRNDLLRFYPEVDPSRVKVIYNGVSAHYHLLEKPIAARRPFFLYVGFRDAYKNFDFAVKIVAGQPDYDLYVVGPPLSKRESSMLEKVLKGHYKMFTGINENLLNELYNSAFCLLYPSEYEGFGIPLLEAMSAGCPFIALNRSAIPEVAGAAGVLLETADLDAAAEAISTITHHRQVMIDKGLQQAGKFSWNTCYNQTFQLYKSLQ